MSTSFLASLDTAGSLPALEAAMRFAGQRQPLIAHNIANLETPDFRPVDVSPRAFQRTLAKAIDERRALNGGGDGALRLQGNRELVMGAGGAFSLKPRTPSSNILFHDRNNRDLERTLQSLVENAAAFRTAADFMRARTGTLRDAIAERVG